MSEDGAEFTVIALVDHNEPVVMLALCVGGSRHHDVRSNSYQGSLEAAWRRSTDDEFFP